MLLDPLLAGSFILKFAACVATAVVVTTHCVLNLTRQRHVPLDKNASVTRQRCPPFFIPMVIKLDLILHLLLKPLVIKNTYFPCFANLKKKHTTKKKF